ncbi:hypothetical protein HOLDEFILI_03975 [Holdemania filiformis DSM 12042]|uniref:Uncharacterized protein n=1 Tax=Holdemania filiformis DSM 12042 TaxID=545696 RepID=B9YDQ2_9FIRM|nr:hypothetical protein HOLDEFILI_03975 [Holdemania filiformis DSM 12042]
MKSIRIHRWNEEYCKQKQSEGNGSLKSGMPERLGKRGVNK